MADRKKLSLDDRILWGKVARSTRAMPGRVADLDDDEHILLATVVAADKTADRMKPFADTGAGKESPPAKHAERKIHPLEKPVKRKLARGHLALEARIDRHGMVQSEAHGLLLNFLSGARARNLRHVLVITGKGSSMGSDGALKRAVPLWLSLPEFRMLISSYEPAARAHGGEGALYVRLSRSRHGGGEG